MGENKYSLKILILELRVIFFGGSPCKPFILFSLSLIVMFAEHCQRMRTGLLNIMCDDRNIVEVI